jgi:tetratricopeptide (TPR) repeat protein
MRVDNNSLWRSYQRLIVGGDSLQAFTAALDAASLFEERADFRGSGFWHREAYYGIYLHSKPASPIYSKSGERDRQKQPVLKLIASAKQHALRLRFYDAFKLLAQAEEMSRSLPNNEYLLALFYGCRALCMNRVGDIEHTISDYEQAIELMLRAGNLRRAAGLLNSLGFCLAEDQQFERGRECLLRGLEIAERVNARSIQAVLRDSLGYSYSMSKDYYRAESLLKRSTEFFVTDSDLLARIASRLRLHAFYEITHNTDVCINRADEILSAASLLPYEPLRLQLEKRFSRLCKARSRSALQPQAFHGIVYTNGKMEETVSRIRQISQTREAVLILGESGTGKELVARALHQESNRHNGPFIPFNCSSLSRELVESRLFGHRKGSFTDAKSDQLGVIRAADNGTLFLDEIGDLDPQCQGALLRFCNQAKSSQSAQALR